MEKAKKDERLKEIKELVGSFCVEHLNEELQSYALKLCNTLGRKGIRQPWKGIDI